MFVRIKKNQGKQYAYLVKNKWTKEGPRQKVVKYLGRTHVPKKVQDPKFTGLADSYEQTLFNLCKWELKKHGFSEESGKLKHSMVELNAKNKNFLGKNVFKINEGHLCTHMVRQILNFKPRETQEQTIYDYAKVFVDAGIDVPKDVFIELFQLRLQ